MSTRSEGIRAARDAFYKGEPARAVDRFFAEHVDGQMTYEDMAAYEGAWDEPLHTTYRGYDVYTADAWSQGPRLILMLNMLENFDLQALGYNTPEYIHVISQVINLAMSDSHKYLGDPDFVEIPEELYSKEYAQRENQAHRHGEAPFRTCLLGVIREHEGRPSGLADRLRQTRRG